MTHIKSNSLADAEYRSRKKRLTQDQKKKQEKKWKKWKKETLNNNNKVDGKKYDHQHDHQREP